MQVKKESTSSYPGLMERKIRDSSRTWFLATACFNSTINTEYQPENVPSVTKMIN